MKSTTTTIITMSALVKRCGPARVAPVNDAEYQRAVKAGRIMTIHHSEGWHPLYGEPGHQTMNVVERVIFAKPLPAAIRTVTGIKRDLLNETDANTIKTLTEIAKTHLNLETLEVRGGDSLDFKEQGVNSIKSALLAAYEAGRASK